MEPNYDESESLVMLWKDAYGSPESRIGTEFLARQVKMYSARAKFYQALSLGLLIVTVWIVAYGIQTFVAGDVGDEVLAESEVDLREKVNKVQTQIDKLDSEAAQASEYQSIVRRSQLLTSILVRARTGAEALSANPERPLAESVHKLLRLSAAILDILLKEPLPEIAQVFVTDLEPGESNAFSGSALIEVKSGAAAKSINLLELKTELQKLDATVEDLLQNKAEGDPPILSRDASKPLQKALGELEQLAKLNSLNQYMVDKLAQADAGAQAIAERQSARTTEKQGLEKQKASLERELAKVREQREKILFMSWIPGLTLRVGTVVLLLFLTQVFLATYRYAAGVSAFYLARSDALRMVQPLGAEADRYAPEQLFALMEALTPTRYQIDAVKDPSELLGDLARSWIARK